MDDAVFRVEGLGGKKTLRGEVRISGAKNSVLPALATPFLFDGAVSFTNLPAISDVSVMRDILISLGASLTDSADGTLSITASETSSSILPADVAKRIRASVVLIGPILARYGKITFPHPGGDVIGPRPIDLFLDGCIQMGATLAHEGDAYELTAPKGLRGAEIFFKMMSVTATESFIFAAVLAKGTTTLKNCAMEPEVVDLAYWLVACGAKIQGAGTPTIVIEGGAPLAPPTTPYRIIPDRIETGSFLILGALTADELTITNCNPSHLELPIALLKTAGVPITTFADQIILKGNGAVPNSDFKSFDFRTHEYPGFATDLQAPMSVFLTQSSGEAIVFETVFEDRLNYVSDLVRMGADINVWNPHRMAVKGPASLKGRELAGPDIRAGLAYLIAALVASGESTITNVKFIDRGYAHIEERLALLGASVTRVHSSS